MQDTPNGKDDNQSYHSNMFHHLVGCKEEKAERLMGMVAYSIYKAKKKDYIVTNIDITGEPPKPKDTYAYTESLVRGSIDGYRKEAKDLLIEYALEFSRGAAARSAVEKELLTKVGDLAEQARPMSYPKSVGFNVVVTLSTSALLFVLLGGISLYKPDSNFGKVFQAVVMNTGTITIEPYAPGADHKDTAPAVPAAVPAGIKAPKVQTQQP